MSKERDKIKSRMAEINISIQQKVELLDITGGERGMRNNQMTWNDIKRLKNELMKLNKKLLNNETEKLKKGRRK